MTAGEDGDESLAGSFPRPPATFVDAEGHDVDLRAYDGRTETFEALVEMYVDFDPADRAQGVPPTDEGAIREWLDGLLSGAGYGDAGGGDSCNVLAYRGDVVVGHATLVSDGGGAYELAIFVHQDSQGLGIGTALIRHLLGHGAANGVEEVWLTVERWNHAAVALYRKVGFETVHDEGFEIEMALELH